MELMLSSRRWHEALQAAGSRIGTWMWIWWGIFGVFWPMEFWFLNLGILPSCCEANKIVPEGFNKVGWLRLFNACLRSALLAFIIMALAVMGARLGFWHGLICAGLGFILAFAAVLALDRLLRRRH